MAVLLSIILLVFMIGGDDAVPKINASPKGAKSNQGWSAGFIDETNQTAVEEWARGMCRGLSIKEAAAAFGTEPTTGAIADKISSDLPSATRIAARRACEAELRKVEQGS